MRLSKTSHASWNNPIIWSTKYHREIPFTIIFKGEGIKHLSNFKDGMKFNFFKVGYNGHIHWVPNWTIDLTLVRVQSNVLCKSSVYEIFAELTTNLVEDIILSRLWSPNCQLSLWNVYTNWKFCIPTNYNFAVIYPWNLLFS